MFIPDNIDLGQTEKYILSIRISDTEFSFSMHEPIVNGAFCYKATQLPKDASTLNEIQSIIFDYNFLIQKYKQTNVIFVSDNYELIPEYLRETSKTNELYNFTHESKSNKVIVSPSTIQEKAILFDANEEVYKFLVRSLFNPLFFHHTDPILRFVSEKNRIAEQKNRMYLHFYDNSVDIISYNKNSKLEHIVTLSNKSEYDQVYHILNIWEKGGFDQRNDLLYILGNNITAKQEAIIKTLKEYINTVSSVSLPNELDLLNIQDECKAPLDLLILSVS